MKAEIRVENENPIVRLLHLKDKDRWWCVSFRKNQRHMI